MSPLWGSRSGRLFADRADAGRQLAELVAEHLCAGGRPPATASSLVLALPRGGVPVAAPIAERLGCRLEVLVARKIGLPWQPEFGVGAIAEGGPPVFNERALLDTGLREADLHSVVEHERDELGRRVAAYRGGRPLCVEGAERVVLVDDGLATGITAVAAVRRLVASGVGEVLVAVPVCSSAARTWLSEESAAVLALKVPSRFGAVGAFYDDFSQVPDGEVVALLSGGGPGPPPSQGPPGGGPGEP